METSKQEPELVVVLELLREVTAITVTHSIQHSLVITETSLLVKCIEFLLLEKILKHGLKNLSFWSTTTPWDYLERLDRCIPDTSDFLQRIHRNAATSEGRGILFIRLGLNERSLGVYLSGLFWNAALTKEYYSDQAWIRREDVVEVILSELETLKTVEWELKIEDDRGKLDKGDLFKGFWVPDDFTPILEQELKAHEMEEKLRGTRIRRKGRKVDLGGGDASNEVVVQKKRRSRRRSKTSMKKEEEGAEEEREEEEEEEEEQRKRKEREEEEERKKREEEEEEEKERKRREEETKERKRREEEEKEEEEKKRRRQKRKKKKNRIVIEAQSESPQQPKKSEEEEVKQKKESEKTPATAAATSSSSSNIPTDTLIEPETTQPQESPPNSPVFVVPRKQNVRMTESERKKREREKKIWEQALQRRKEMEAQWQAEVEEHRIEKWVEGVKTEVFGMEVSKARRWVVDSKVQLEINNDQFTSADDVIPTPFAVGKRGVEIPANYLEA